MHDHPTWPAGATSGSGHARLLRITSLFSIVIALLFITKVALTLAERAGEPVSDLAAREGG